MKVLGQGHKVVIDSEAWTTVQQLKEKQRDWVRTRHADCRKMHAKLHPFIDSPMSRNAQNAKAWWCNKQVIVWFCVCTGDNPLAKARGLPARTATKTAHPTLL